MRNLSDKISFAIEFPIMPCGVATKNVPSTYELMSVTSSTFISSKSLSKRNVHEINKIKLFADLDSSWDSYNAEQISKQVIKDGIRFIEGINEYSHDVYFSAPGPNGEISLEIKNGTKNAEFLIYPGSRAKFLLFNGDQFLRQGNASIKILPEIIRWLFE